MKILQAQYSVTRDFERHLIPQSEAEALIRKQIYQQLAYEMLSNNIPEIMKESSVNPGMLGILKARVYVLDRDELRKIHSLLNVITNMVPNEYKYLVEELKQLL